jgi:hypothetical protein
MGQYSNQKVDFGLKINKIPKTLSEALCFDIVPTIPENCKKTENDAGQSN